MRKDVNISSFESLYDACFCSCEIFENKQDVNKKQTPSKFGPLILGPFIIRIGIACVHPEKRRVGDAWWR